MTRVSVGTRGDQVVTRNTKILLNELEWVVKEWRKEPSKDSDSVTRGSRRFVLYKSTNPDLQINTNIFL